MKHEGSVELFLYWDKLRDGRMAPKRTDIEPAEIRTRLADTFILEKDARGEAIFRLAGTRLCAIFGRELKGFSFSGLWAGRDRDVTARRCAEAFGDKNVSVIGLDAHSRDGKSCQFEMILLPLDGGRNSPRILGAISAMELPFWFGVDPVLECCVTSIRMVDIDREPEYLNLQSRDPAPTFPPVRDGLNFANRPIRPGRRVKHLVVLKGGLEEDGNRP